MLEQQSNPEAEFEALYREFYPGIREFFLHSFPEEEAEELTQDTFLRAYRGLGSFRGSASMRTWLQRIARNVGLNTQRDQRARKRRAKLVQMEEHDIPDSARTPIHRLELESNLFLLSRAISSISPRQQEILRRRTAGESLANISNGLGISVNTIKTSLDHAYRELRVRVASSPSLELQARLGESPTDRPGTGQTLAATAPVVPPIIQDCTQELMSWLARHPEHLRQVHPGTFERIVASVFEAEGFEVEILSSWNQPDGGVDLLAVQRIAHDLDIRVAIQCKRNRKENRVTAEPIRSLAGVLDRFRAHAGVVATTSSFTKNAIEEAQRHFWKITLQEYRDIVEALKAIGGYQVGTSGLWLPARLEREEE